jgi:hypothetical protein
MERILAAIVAFAGAIILAALFASIGHEGLGISRATIRADALAGAAFMCAAVACGAFLRRKT